MGQSEFVHRVALCAALCLAPSLHGQQELRLERTGSFASLGSGFCDVSFSSNESHLLSAGRNGDMLYWNLNAMRLVRSK